MAHSCSFPPFLCLRQGCRCPVHPSYPSRLSGACGRATSARFSLVLVPAFPVPVAGLPVPGSARPVPVTALPVHILTCVLQPHPIASAPALQSLSDLLAHRLATGAPSHWNPPAASAPPFPLDQVRPKSCAFINFFSEETAVAILDRFGGSEATLPTLHGHRITMNFAKARPCSDEQLARYRQGARRSLQLVHRRETTHEAILAAIGHRAEMVLRIEEEPGWAEAEEGGGERAEAGGDSAGGGGRAGARQVEETVVTRVDFSSVGAACAAHDILERERLEAVAAHENVMAGGEGAGTPTGEHRSLILRVQFVVLPLKELPPLPQPPAGVEAGGEGAEPGRVGARAGRETPAASDEAAREAAVAMEALSVEEPAESAGGE